MNEEQLIKKAKKNKKYFDTIYSSNYEKIFIYIKGFIHNRETSEDLTSITFEKALKGIDNFQWEGVSIQSWLYRIARNTVNDYIRHTYTKNAKSKVDADESYFSNSTTGETLEHKIIQDSLEENLYRIIMYFDEEEQYLIYYKYFEDMQNRNIAKILNISETNVGTKLLRLRNKIKLLINNNEKNL